MCCCCQNRNPIIAVRAISFRKEVLEVIGKQSPKHPQFLCSPVMKVYPVRKVKNTMSNKSSHMKSLVLQPSNSANPAMISNAFINTESSSVWESNCEVCHTSKYSCIL